MVSDCVVESRMWHSSAQRCTVRSSCCCTSVTRGKQSCCCVTHTSQ